MLHLTAGVMALVVVDARVLLARTTYDPGIWRLPGGYLEAGESPQAGLQREIMEELSCEAAVRELAGVYYKSYEANLNLVFAADLRGTPVPDGNELAEIDWHPLDALPEATSPRQRRVIEGWSATTAPRVWTFTSAGDR
jgi:8-oxo-dGTP pyrophosphatase MutT (NUDIX family)